MDFARAPEPRFAPLLALCAIVGATAGCQRSHDLGRLDHNAGDATGSGQPEVTPPIEAGAAGSGGDAGMTGADAADVAEAPAPLGADPDAGSDVPDGPELPTHVAGACFPACRGAGQSCVRGLCDDGTNRWITLGGDIHHSGYNPHETGHPPLKEGWSVQLGGGTLGPAVTDGQTVWVSGVGGVAAFVPAGGRELWRTPMDQVNFGGATFNDGDLLVTVGGALASSFTPETGKLWWSAPLPKTFGWYGAPLVVGSRLYVASMNDTGLVARETADGTPVWGPAGDQGSTSYWTPLYLDGYIYSYASSFLYVYDAATGSFAYATWLGTPGDMFGVPISDGEQLYITTPSSLRAFPPHADKAAWATPGAYTGTPAVANGVVYAFAGGELLAHDAATGEVLWMFQGDGGLDGAPVVANHWVYVTSPSNFYAVDIDTQQIGAHEMHGGALAIANGQLYLARADGAFFAYDLTR